jgi:trk system potassium uptake protein TrkH
MSSDPSPRRSLPEIVLSALALPGGIHPARKLTFGYLTYVLGGWLLLCLPFAQKGKGVSALDNLFMATSAVSTTGLATTSVSDDYSFFGQIVILTLIQLGGIGYMTLGSFIILSRRPELPPDRAEVSQAAFSLPEGFRIEKFLRSVILFTVLIELAGTMALFPVFTRARVPSPLWSALFHSVSAFCTAGFGLYNNSLEAFAGDFWMNAVIAALAFLGAMGFIVCVDVWRVLTGHGRRVTLTTRIIVWTTFWMTSVGTLLFFLTEPSVRPLPIHDRLLASFFQCMSAMTTVGFNTVPIGSLSKASVLLMIVLMVIGASPSGTGGGLKCTTLSAILGVMRSALRGEKEVRFWGHVVPIERVWTACASAGFYLVGLVGGAYLLELTEKTPFDQDFFEAASALGTVGLSLGITPGLTNLGKILIILLMFLGRVGPQTFSVALFVRKEEPPGRRDLAV